MYWIRVYFFYGLIIKNRSDVNGVREEVLIWSCVLMSIINIDLYIYWVE